MCAEIVDIAKRERVDCVLLAGDIFDSPAPSADAQRVVCDAMAEIAGAGMAAVIVGGNHDRRRLTALRKLAGRLQIFIRPGPREGDESGVISYPKNGEMAKIAMLPWIPEYRIIDSRQMPRPRNEWHQVYSENLAARCSRLADGFATNTINILLAHLFVDGAETTGSERPAHVSQPFAVRPDQLPRAHYIALGHLHKPQEVPTSSPCAYAGSPLQLDFGERGQRKRVAIVDASVESPAVVESIPLVSGRKLRDVVTTIDKLDSVAREAGSDFLRWLSGHGRKYPVCRSRSRRRCRTRSRSIRNSQQQRRFPALAGTSESARALPAVCSGTEEPGCIGGNLVAFDELYREAKYASDEA